MTQPITLQPIAFMRAGDRVIFWMDTPEGWRNLTLASNQPRALLVADVLLADLSDSPDGDVLVLPHAATSLPLALPEGQVAGVHPSLLQQPGLPQWTGPATRAEELGALATDPTSN